jgi:hypothetical protein
LVVEFNHVREELAGADRHFDVLGFDLDRHRAARAAVKHAGDQVGFAGGAGRARAGALTLLDVQNNASHGAQAFKSARVGKMEAGLLAEGPPLRKAGVVP